MRCLICKRLFYKNRTFKTFFKEPVLLKCPGCEKKYVAFPFEIVLPIEKHTLYLTTIFIEPLMINDQAFMIEINQIFTKYYHNMKPNDLFIFVEVFEEALFNFLEEINCGDIYAISLFPSKFFV